MRSAAYRLCRLLAVLALFAFAICPAAESQSNASVDDEPPAGYKAYAVEEGYYSCLIPESWPVQPRDREDDKRDKIYQIVLLGPRADGSPTMIFIGYYDEGNNVFDDYQDFLERNTYDDWEEKVLAVPEEIKLNGRDALMFVRDGESSVDPESPASAVVKTREKFYLIKGKSDKAFYLLHYYAPASVYAEHEKIFDDIVRSFRATQAR